MSKIKNLTILGISIWQIFFYFIIYSFLGYIIETIFGIITMGVWQSRQSFIYGPFCGIYGVGAVVIIIFSKYFNKNNYTLFIGGILCGSITEYLISFFVELILDTRWWDYSNNILNINGRICLLYSIFWGILTVFLIKYFNPVIDYIINKLYEKFSQRLIKRILLAIIIFISLDCLLTCFAQDIFITKITIENNIEMKDIQRRKSSYEKIKNNEFLNTITNKLFSNEKMIKTFPNLKIKDKNENTIYIDSLLKDIKPYYLKIFEK